MCLIPEWDLFVPGVIVAILGFIVLLCIIPIYRKEHPKKPRGKVNLELVLTFTIGIVGSLVMGFGMSLVMVGEATRSEMLFGIVIGVVGLIVCVLNYPVYSYIKTNKK